MEPPPQYGGSIRESEIEEVDINYYVYGDQVNEKTERKIIDAITLDRKDEFVNMLKDLTRAQVRSLYLYHYLFWFDAANCVDAVLNGEITGKFEINVNAVPFSCSEKQLLPILHNAACYGASEITKKLLTRNEAQVDLRIGDVDGMKEVLPLNLALKHLCLKVKYGGFDLSYGGLDLSYVPNEKDEKDEKESPWVSEPTSTEPERLVLKLIFHLCRQSCKKHAEVVRLLASRTADIEQEFLKYLKERKLIELTALLMFARNSVLFGLEGRCTIRDIVSKEIAMLKIFILRSNYDVGSDALMFEAQKKKMEMEAILLLLELFDRIGDKIDAYLHLHYSEWDSNLSFVSEVSWLLKEAGFDAEFELQDQTSRGKGDPYFLPLTLDPPKNNVIFKRSTFETSGLNNNANGGSEEDNPYHRASDKEINNKKSKQASTHWFENKQELVGKLDRWLNIFYNEIPDYSSTLANNAGRSDFSCQSFRRTYHTRSLFDSTTSDKVNNGTLKNQYKDCGKSVRRTEVYSLASSLQFNRKWILPVNSSRRILWIANKLSRVL